VKPVSPGPVGSVPEKTDLNHISIECAAGGVTAGLTARHTSRPTGRSSENRITRPVKSLMTRTVISWEPPVPGRKPPVSKYRVFAGGLWRSEGGL
jgi:hypothetical protein